MSRSRGAARGAVLGLLCCGMMTAGCGRARSPAPAIALVDASPSPVTAKAVPDAGVALAPDPRVCPGAVAGASTRVKDVVDGVELLITARNPRATAEIRKRAGALASLRTGGPGGTSAGCAIHYVPGAETTIDEVHGGVSVIITATSPDAVAGLRHVARTRAAALAHAGGRSGTRS